MRIITLLLIAFTMIISRRAPCQELSSTPNPKTWVTNGRVTAIMQDKDKVYLGGQFYYVGPNTGHCASLDSATGTAVSSFPKVSGTVCSIVPDSQGGCFIGGCFTRVGAYARNSIAHILSDYSVDPAWNPDAFNSTNVCNVYALSVSGNRVYAGGDFTSIGGRTRNYIACLDATTGLATDWNPNANLLVSTLCTSGNSVYVSGYFDTIGGQARGLIACLDKTTGLATAWNPNANSEVLAFSVSGNSVYAGGAFSSIGGQERHFIACLSATSGLATAWNPNANDYVNALSVIGSSIYVGGYFDTIGGTARDHIACLDATTGLATAWNPKASYSPSSSYICTISALIVRGNNAYIGGDFDTINDQPRKHIACLDVTTGLTTAWNPGASDPVLALLVSGNGVYAGGDFTSIGGKTRNNIACFDTTTGSATDWNPNANNGVSAISASGNNVYIAGAFDKIGGQTRNYIGCIDAFTGLVTSWNPNANANVRTLSVSASNVYVGGDFTSIGGQARNHAACLDTSTGLATDYNPNADSSVAILSVNGNIVYACGKFTSIGGQPRRNIASLDATTGFATSWNLHPYFEIYNGEIYALCLNGDRIYVGGYFSDIGGQQRNNIACFDASTGGLVQNWNPNLNNPVSVISVNGNNVYVGGFFTLIGGQKSNSIACLDATTGFATGWNPDANNSQTALSASGSSVYVGGYFTSIGGSVCPYFARFDFIGSTAARHRNGNSLFNAFSVSSSGTTIYYTIVKNSPVSLRVFDMRGRRIASLVNCNQAPGNYSVSLGSRRLPAGTYVLQLKTGDFSAMRRCALER